MKPSFANESFLRQMKDEAFWRTLHPDLDITPQPLRQPAPAQAALDQQGTERCVTSLVVDGYFQAPPLVQAERAARLARLVQDLAARDIPEVFAFIYDEVWQLFTAVGGFLSLVLGPNYRLTPSEIWMFHVPMGVESTGWAPHRDLLTQDTFQDNGLPTALTVWIPLTDATPENGCMYVLPQWLDPGITPEGLQAPTPSLGLLQNVRALPAAAGSVLGWNTRLLHWGGRSSHLARQPRIAAGIYLQASDLELNRLRHQRNEPARHLSAVAFHEQFELPFPARLRAIGQALDIYGSRLPTDVTSLIDALR